MLKTLAIQNIAIVDQLNVDFTGGMTVITGETGAGKSILMDAFLLVFGAKVSPRETLRHNTERGNVELTVAIAGLVHEAAIRGFIKEAGIPLDDDEGEILISREFTTSGSRMRINGSPVTREILSTLRPMLLDVHGQHELTRLFDMAYQKECIDSLGGEALEGLKTQTQKAYQNWQAKKRQLDAITNNRQAYEQQRDFLSFQLQELSDADLNEANEDETLQQDLQVLSHAEKLLQHSGKASTMLSEGQAENPAVLDTIDKIRGLVDAMAECDASLKPLLETVESAYAQLQDASVTLSRYNDRVEYNPGRIKEIVDRLDTLEKVKRKYGPRLSDAIAKRDAIEAELATLSLDEEGLEKLEQECATLEKTLHSIATELSGLRKAIAGSLQETLTSELKTLALPAVRFDVRFAESPLSEDGFDTIEFLFSANPGEPLRPLAKTASGGELSRFLLALKVITAQSENIETLVFDEIDTGISGTTARAVAEKLVQLSTQTPHSQIIVITHQLTVAVMADAHLYVEKNIIHKGKPAEAVNVSVNRIGTDAQHKATRLSVLSRMASGMTSDDDEAIERFVQRLCDEAQAYKQTLKKRRVPSAR